MKLLIEQNEDGGKRRNAAKKKRNWKPPKKRIAELSAIFKRLYEDSVTGRISKTSVSQSCRQTMKQSNGS